MMRLVSALVLFAALILGAEDARAHALQPGYLELRPITAESWRAVWRKPAVQGRPMAIDVLLPETCDARTPPEPRFDGTAYTAHWVATCPGGLAGGTIAIPGLEATQTDVLVRYELGPDAGGEARRLTASDTSFVVPADPGAFEVLRSYFSLGVDHILDGIDHLLFVFALLLLIPDRWKLLGAVTAFTVAHSITLALATFGWVSLPGPPVEAVIALSIMFLASELVMREGTGQRLSERWPWTVSFSFGLLHGFGFAGALEEIGLPRGDVPLALLAFNLGVEAGQILFIAAMLVIGAVLARLFPTALATARQPGSLSAAVLAYGIGGISAYWFIERIAGF